MERRRIQQLSAGLVNRIAAGEVIERPAAVVKELVENSIDAGATQIIVEAEDGGRALVRVTDDGSGIAPDDLLLAFASHATSKLTCDDDLFRIGTMGFRGEALASIGAVSHARILSRTADTDTAYEVTNRGGAITDVQAAAGNIGTTIEVRNLFFNTPARRKFIKGTGTEFGHIGETLLRLALPHPTIAFKLIHNGRTTLDLPAATEEQRLLAAWPKEFHEQRLPLRAGDAEVRLRGLVGLPELARPTAKYQFLYLNGRSIRDRFMQHALREAYRGLTEPGRHPAAVLLLEMPPGDVDVNVHPTKTEVRFRDSGRVHGLVLSGVREKLLGSDLTPSAVPMSTDGSGPGDDPARQDLREKLADFFRQMPGSAASQSTPVFPTLSEGGANSPAGTRLVSPEPRGMPPWARPVPLPFSRAAEPAPKSAAALTTIPASLTSLEVVRDNGADASPATQTTTPAPPDPASGWKPATHGAIQLHNSYLVAQSDDGLIIIDQHALHERIMYEELLARVSRGPLESQRLLIPLTVAVSSIQMSLLDHVQPLLARLGVEVTSFGPGSVAVHAFPTFMEKLDPGEFVRELLERGEQELLDLHEEELLHGILDMMACKAAVKAGDPLSPGEIEALLARRELVERSSNCPHGRPTTLRLTLRDLEKQFKRTGF